MANIRINPDLLDSKATEVRTYKAQHDESIAKIKTLVNGLTEIWEGDAQKAFEANFNAMESTFNAFSESLESYAKDMNKAAEAFRVADQTL